MWEKEGGALHLLVDVAQSLGDTWSYNEHDSYMVSPIPNVQEYKINPEESRLLTVANDACGLCLRARRQWTLCSLYNRRRWQKVDGRKDLCWWPKLSSLRPPLVTAEEKESKQYKFSYCILQGAR